MGQITLTLPDDLISGLRDAVAVSPEYATISEYVRAALREKKDGPSYWERVGLVLAIQNNTLLTRLAGKAGIDVPSGIDALYEDSLEPLQKGYAAHYRDGFAGIEAEPLERKDTQYVWDVLDLFYDMQSVAIRTKDATLIDATVFDGFNNYRQARFAAYIYASNHKYTELRLTRPGDLTSPRPGHDSYPAMVMRWKQLKQQGPIGPQALQEILAAGNAH